MAKLAPAFERAIIQRLGYLLDYVKQSRAPEGVYAYLQEAKPLTWVKLDPGRAAAKSSVPVERNTR